MITLIIWLYDYYRPVYDARSDESPLKIRSLGGLVKRVRWGQP
ncbi:MAG TPA: hypothetical protein VMK83_07755 [Gaiellaceae bacterium]|nr:hypothetical protein [Gaiellaceae bacterium]